MHSTSPRSKLTFHVLDQRHPRKLVQSCYLTAEYPIACVAAAYARHWQQILGRRDARLQRLIRAANGRLPVHIVTLSGAQELPIGIGQWRAMDDTQQRGTALQEDTGAGLLVGRRTAAVENVLCIIHTWYGLHLCIFLFYLISLLSRWS